MGSCSGNESEVKPVKNIILMIPDGTSTSLLATTRWYKEFTSPQDGKATLSFDPYICGLVRQQSTDAPIPESSGGISSLMTGYFVHGPNISVYPPANKEEDIVRVNPDSPLQPLATVMEAARLLKNKRLGLVATVAFTHATPAGTSAHSATRYDNPTIARQMAANNVDVVLAGGNAFIGEKEEELLKMNGTEIIRKDVKAFREFSGDKVWALFADDYMSMQADRDDRHEPSLEEMTTKALDILSDSPDGFFLMVEGSKIDYAAHANDPYGVVTEFSAFDRAVGIALDFAKKDGNTAVIVVPDHGTAGVSFGDNKYYEYSTNGLGRLFAGMSGFRKTSEALESEIRLCDVKDIPAIFEKGTGIKLNEKELAMIVDVKDEIAGNYMEVAYSYTLQSVIARIMKEHTNMGFVSGGHTSEDVFLAVYNPNGQRPEGYMPAYELASYMAELAGLPMTLDQLTSEIFVRHDILLKGHDYEIEGEGIERTLVVDGVLRLPANVSYAEKNGEMLPLGSISVYVKQNGMFYVSKKVLELI